MKTTTAGPSGVLIAGALGGIVTAAVLVTPAATAAKDPCTASEVARTVGKVIHSTGDYLDGHPETNQVLTAVLQQPPSPQSIGMANAYFDANPKVRSEIQAVTKPLTEVTTSCKLAIGLPQMLSLLQGVGAQDALPGGTGAQPPAGVLSSPPPLTALR